VISTIARSSLPLLPSRLTLTPLPILRHKRQARNPVTQRTPPLVIRTTPDQRHHAIIHNDSNQFLIRLTLTHHLLKVRPASKRHAVSRAVPIRLLHRLQRRVAQLHRRGIEQTQCGEDTDHRVVVREVCEQRAAEGKRRVGGVKSLVRAGSVTSCVRPVVSHASKQLVGKPDTLAGSEVVTRAVGVPLVDTAEVVVLRPLLYGEEGTEWGQRGTGDGLYGVEGAEVHEIDNFRDGEISAGEVCVDAGLDGRDEDIFVGCVSRAVGFGFVAVFIIVAGRRVERVVAACGFGQDDNVIIVRGIVIAGCALCVTVTGGTVALSEVLGGLDDTLVAGRADEGDVGAC